MVWVLRGVLTVAVAAYCSNHIRVYGMVMPIVVNLVLLVVVERFTVQIFMALVNKIYINYEYVFLLTSNQSAVDNFVAL